MKKGRGFKRVTRRTNCDGQRLEVVKVGYVAIPDAAQRLSRAMDILLRLAEKHTAASGEVFSVKREEPPLQDYCEDRVTSDDEKFD